MEIQKKSDRNNSQMVWSKIYELNGCSHYIGINDPGIAVEILNWIDKRTDFEKFKFFVYWAKNDDLSNIPELSIEALRESITPYLNKENKDFPKSIDWYNILTTWIYGRMYCLALFQIDLFRERVLCFSNEFNREDRIKCQYDGFQELTLYLNDRYKNKNKNVNEINTNRHYDFNLILLNRFGRTIKNQLFEILNIPRKGHGNKIEVGYDDGIANKYIKYNNEADIKGDVRFIKVMQNIFKEKYNQEDKTRETQYKYLAFWFQVRLVQKKICSQQQICEAFPKLFTNNVRFSRWQDEAKSELRELLDEAGYRAEILKRQYNK